MRKYEIVAIIDLFGNSLPIEKMDFLHIGKDYAIGQYKGFGFTQLYSAADCYKVITKEI